MNSHKHDGYKFTLNAVSYEWDRYITGAQLRQIGNIKEDDILFLKIEGKDQEIHDTESVDLARVEIESFYTLPRNPNYKIRINTKQFEWKERYISDDQLRKLGHIPPEETLYLKIEGKDQKIEHHDRIDIARLGVEEFYSKPDKPHGTILLTIETTKGKWSKHPFPEKLTVAELIKMVVKKFHFADDGNYQIKIRGGDILEQSRTLESYGLDDCTILSFTDLGKGA